MTEIETELPTPAELQRRCAELFAQWQVLDHEVEVVLSDRDPNFKTTAPKSVKVNGSVCLPSPSPTPSILASPGEQPS